MARTAGKKQAPAKVEEDDDNEGWEDAVVEADGETADLRLRDWRDVERFREMKELRGLVDDDYGLEEIFHVPLKPRVEVPPRQPKIAAAARQLPVKPAPAPKPTARHAPAPTKLVPAKKARAHAAAKAKPKAKLKIKAKAKRR
ncbi:MAG: hypothetical protein ACT4PK_06700 [Gammaproteobacteria bacterium]